MESLFGILERNRLAIRDERIRNLGFLVGGWYVNMVVDIDTRHEYKYRNE